MSWNMNKAKKLRTFYIFPLMYVISVYLFPVCFFTKDDVPFLSYLMYAPLIFGILNIVMSVRCCKPEYHNILLNSTVLVKYSMIPFFILGGIITVGCLLVSLIPVPFMIFFGPVMAFICCVIGWLILAFGAPYTISYLCLSRKLPNSTKFITIIHAILQFFFMADVFDVMYLTLREKKWTKLTLTLLVMLAVMMITAFVSLEFIIIKHII